jgi:hypothetical protein
MRVGEILLEHGWIDWETLALALTDQRGSGVRLCSLLVARRQLEFDRASRALGEQRGTAAVLRKHLERRDRRVAALLPAGIARAHVALPIGRLGNGSLIVSTRDPTPALQADLSRVLRGPFVMAIAPARYIEQLVEHVYADVDVPIDVELDSGDDPAFDFDIDVEEPDTDIPVEIEVDIDQPRPARPRSRALPAVIARNTTRDALDATIATFCDIDDLEWLFDAVMGYITRRWATGLVLAIGELHAVGVRGHGARLKPSATRALAVALDEPSIIQLARDERRLVTEPPARTGPGHRKLLAALGTEQPAAAVIVKEDRVEHVIVVGDPLAGEREDAARDLEVLAEATSLAVERL